MYTRTEVLKGIELAAAWYEGWKLDELQPEQIMEAIEFAHKPDMRDWSGCCC